MTKNIRLEKIIGNSEQIITLYELLKNRVHNISHKNMPNFYEHTNFVKNNPYKVWYLVLNSKKPIGSFYIKNNNSVGLKLSLQSSHIVDLIIKYITSNYKPEIAKASEVPPYFYFNVAKTNNELIDILNQLNKVPIQISYKF